jgi:LPS sulfotransferase NodH
MSEPATITDQQTINFNKISSDCIDMVRDLLGDVLTAAVKREENQSFAVSFKLKRDKESGEWLAETSGKASIATGKINREAHIRGGQMSFLSPG